MAEKKRTEYKRAYQQNHYQAYTVRFNLVTEADYIEMLNTSGSVKSTILEGLKALKREQARKQYLKDRRKRIRANEKQEIMQD